MPKQLLPSLLDTIIITLRFPFTYAVIFRGRIFRLPNFLLPIFLVAVFSVVFPVFIISDNFVMPFLPTVLIFVAEFSYCPIF